MANYAIKANPEIRPLGPVTDADVGDIRECFRLELGVRDTARKLGLSQAQVVAAKKKHGLTSTPPPEHQQTHTQAAEAFATKARRNRQSRYDDYSEINELSRGKLLAVLRNEVKHKTILRGAMGMESQVEVDQIPARDLREWANALVQLEVALVKIEDKEDDSGQTRALSMLEKFTEAAAVIAGGTLPAPREGLIQE